MLMPETRNHHKEKPEILHKKHVSQSSLIQALAPTIIEKNFKYLKEILCQLDYCLIMQSPEIISRSARLPIDAEEDSVHREGGMISYLHEKISQWIQTLLSAEDFQKLPLIAEWKTFSIGTGAKKYDTDPFLNDHLKTLTINDRLLALVHSRRTEFNHAEINAFCYPQAILTELKKPSLSSKK